MAWAAGRGIPAFPGCATPTEILAAWRAGAAAVKLFPASSAGPGFVREMSGPFPEIPLVPTGGVTVETAPAFIAAGAVAVGMGGWLLGDGAAGRDPGTCHRGRRRRRPGQARRQPMTEVVTLGECLIAFVATTPGPLAEATTFERFVVGAEANVAVGLARLGHSVAFIGRVGADGFGEAIARRLRGEGVDISDLAIDPDAPTGLMFRERRVLGPAQVVYARSGSAGSRLTAAEVERALARHTDSRWLHLTGITPALSDDALEATDARDRVRARGRRDHQPRPEPAPPPVVGRGSRARPARAGGRR